MLKPSLQLRLGQQLTMTPQLQQAIRLLQLPIIELQGQIQEALESNVMLETIEDAPDPEPAGAADTDAEPMVVNEAPSSDETWTDVPGPRSGDNWNSGEPRPTQEFADLSGKTLAEHLLAQLRLEHLTPGEAAVGEAIVDAINDDGYLIEDLETITEAVAPEFVVRLEQAEALLRLVQRFDPPGVGARTLAECLVLQLDLLENTTPGLDIAHQIAMHYLELVAAQQYAALRRRLHASEDELEQALALVRSLHPRPGSAVYAPTAEYVIPDVFVRKLGDRWLVEVNGGVAPRLQVNQGYASLLNRGADHTQLRAQLQEARWLVRSLEIRSETLLKVATCIIERQHEFLDRGDEAMRPMVLRDVAEELDMHESTISRVTTNKYMHTPRGIFEFRHFFSSHVGSDGAERSSTAIRAMIKKLIANEDPDKPLSDNKIAQLLIEDGVNVARRTVAKYREALTIPSSSERKRLALR